MREDNARVCQGQDRMSFSNVTCTSIGNESYAMLLVLVGLRADRLTFQVHLIVVLFVELFETECVAFDGRLIVVGLVGVVAELSELFDIESIEIENEQIGIGRLASKADLAVSASFKPRIEKDESCSRREKCSKAIFDVNRWF